MGINESCSPALLNQRLEDLEFVAFDTETTGAAAQKDRVVELAAVRFTLKHGALAHIETLIDPEVGIPDFVSQIHGIRDEHVAGKPTIEKVLPTFFEFIQGAVGVAHNARFDVDFLAIPSLRHNQVIPPTIVLDSCRLARRLVPEAGSFRLGALTEHFAIPTNQFHRALADTMSCMQVFRHTVESKLGVGITFAELLAHHGKFIEFHRPFPEVSGGQRPEIVAGLMEAIRRQEKVSIEYSGGFGLRKIQPIALYARSKGQYLEAHCYLDNKKKTFRLDRVLSLSRS